jgi:ubiquinone/menaquinone biosynthesis C-methylase UbiE
MNNTLQILLAIICMAILVFVIWRYSSRRHSLPCPVWLRWFVELDNPFTKTNRAAMILQHLHLHQGMTVIDIGCGPGRVTVPLAKGVGQQGKVVAMDIQAGMLKRAREKAATANLHNIQFLHAGVGDGKMGSNIYDRAVLVTVLGEIPDRAAAMREIFQALKPGGLLSVTEIIFDPHFQPRCTLTRFASQAGFREREFYGNRLAYTLNLEKPQD